jgi:hypothetical protein
MPEARTSPRRIRALERRERAMALRVAGKSYADIGAALGVSAQRAYQYVTEELGKAAKRRAESAEAMVRLESDRIDQLWAALWPQCQKGVPRAVEVAVRLLDRRARMLGLDQPAQLQSQVALMNLSPDALLDEGRRLGLVFETEVPALLPGETEPPLALAPPSPVTAASGPPSDATATSPFPA